MSEFLDENSVALDPAREFAGMVEFLPISPDWLAPKISATKLADRLSDSQRSELQGYLRTGLVRAFSKHVYVQYRYDEDKKFSDAKELLNWLERWRFSGGHEEAFHGCFQLPQSFWGVDHQLDTDWTGDFTFPFCQAYMADWKIGKFGAIYDRGEPYVPGFPDQPFEEKMVVGQVVYFGVEFQQEDIEATFGKFEKSGPRRSSTFDWEAAYSDVAAQFYFDIEFADIGARGVQAEIIRMLRQSFEKRGLAVPSDDTLKPKARKLLGALRAKKPE